MAKRTRAKKPEETAGTENRTKVIKVRLNVPELKRLKVAAALNDKTTAEFVRDAALKCALTAIQQMDADDL